MSDLQRQLETCMAEPNPLEREVKFDLIGVGTAIYSPLVQELLWKEASPGLLEVSVSIASEHLISFCSKMEAKVVGLKHRSSKGISDAIH